MDDVKPSKRQAAIKATTQLVDISSDEDDQHGTRRVKGSKSSKRGKGKGTRNGRHSISGSEGLGIAGSSRKKGKRQISTALVGSPQKRQRVSDQDGSIEHAVRNEDDISDLTPLSSGDEQERRQGSFTRPLAEFPLRFSPSGSSVASSRKSNRIRNDYSPPPIPELDDDSDDLPDVGMVLSQQSTTLAKFSNPRTPHKRIFRPRSQSDVNAYLLTSPPTTSPKFSLSSSAPSSRNGGLVDDGTATEMDLSDFSGDSDLEMNSVAVGELCLAKAKAADTIYWPAKIIQTKRQKTGRGKSEQKIYRVLYLDKREKDIPRSWFYIDSQDEFGTCTVGTFQSSHIEVINDFAEESRKDHASSSRRQRPATPSRSRSPVTIPSSPLSGLQFYNQSLRQQFEYVKPVLKAIMNEEYTWGLRRHELYVNGEASRLKLKNEGGLRGAVDARSVDEFLKLVELWCLGCRGRDFDEDEGWNKEGQQLEVPTLNADLPDDVQKPVGSIPEAEAVPEEIPVRAGVLDRGPEPEPTLMEVVTTEEVSLSKFEHSSGEERTDSRPETPPPPSPFISFAQIIFQPETRAPLPREKRQRQHGSTPYENLSPLEKVQYCLEVLLPETLNQILLWRKGERKSVEVMWDDVEEEKRLHERGEQLLRETDWVMDVMRIRRAVAGAKGKNGSAVVEGGAKNKGKDLRRTRSGRVGSIVGSYRE